jgi:signal transduction histidine kinase
MSRLPVRLRLTLTFTVVMAVVLGLTGLLLYSRFASELKSTFDDGLRSRADEVAALARRAGPGLGTTTVPPLAQEKESFAQILDAQGNVVYATPPLSRRPVLDAGELRGLRRSKFLDRDSLPGVGDPVRLLARPLQGRRLVVVVGATRDDRDEALASLAALLFVGGPVALLLASLTGYGVASAALRPVDAMRRQAEEISAVGSGDRLSVPPAGDELGRLGVTLNEMLARLERSVARERRFVADASHELRTPLALLKAELELARREGRSVEELSAAVGSAADEADRLIRLAEDLLVLAHLDEEDLPVHTEGLELDDLLAGAARAFERRASEAGRALVVNAPGGVTLEADRLRLEQAVGNLLDNALRHGGGTIELAAAVAGDRVELHVRDEGAGFPPDLLEHAFERFSRAGPARSRGHAGLGLAIVDSVAQAHGGKVGAVNRARGGADVWIELPLTAVSSRVAINAVRAVDEGGRR